MNCGTKEQCELALLSRLIEVESKMKWISSQDVDHNHL